MIHKDKVETGLLLIVNSKRNVISPNQEGLSLYKDFLEPEIKVKVGTKLKCLSKFKSHKLFSGKYVEVEYNNETYCCYWMELRLQVDYHPITLRKEKLKKINKI